MTRQNSVIARFLTVGLIVAVVLLLVGVILTLVRPGLTPLHVTSVADIPRAVGALEPGGFFDLGLLLLLATPAVRVAALVIGFARRSAWLFSACGVVVLAALAVSVVLGLRG